MRPHVPAPVSEWHNDTYDAISPGRRELSMVGKTVVITGGGTGIGKEVTRTFALAGAASIHILGRRKAPLEETKSLVESEIHGSSITVHGADVTDAPALRKVADEIGAWDVFVANAGYLSETASLADMDLDDWWFGFEVNVKGSAIIAKAFLPHKKANASMVPVATATVCSTAERFPGSSSYTTSKLAMVKFFEFVAAEHLDLQVVTIHPGVVMATDMAIKSGVSGIPEDDIKLAAHFILWAASPEAAFVRGRFLWCNWDVVQLKALEKKIKEEPHFLTAGILGWPFTGMIE